MSSEKNINHEHLFGDPSKPTIEEASREMDAISARVRDEENKKRAAQGLPPLPPN